MSLSERVAPTNRAARTVSFRYAPSGRLVSRTISGGETARLFWLDHIVVLEETAVGGSVARTVNLWGGDVSETLGGAAGVGGLLSVSNAEGTFYPMFDGSGNVSEYLDRSGDIAAHYEYSPFGETLVREGGRADELALRFSTKAVVPGTPLYYYGSRYYSRWLNRDPMGEPGDMNLYRFVDNSPISKIDPFGMVGINLGDFFHINFDTKAQGIPFTCQSESETSISGSVSLGIDLFFGTLDISAGYKVSKGWTTDTIETCTTRIHPESVASHWENRSTKSQVGAMFHSTLTRGNFYESDLGIGAGLRKGSSRFGLLSEVWGTSIFAELQFSVRLSVYTWDKTCCKCLRTSAEGTASGTIGVRPVRIAFAYALSQTGIVESIMEAVKNAQEIARLLNGPIPAF